MFIFKNIIFLCLIFDSLASNTSTRYIFVDLTHEPLGALNPSMNLTLTLVTGSLNNTQIVASYYEFIQGLTVFKRTDLDLKLLGSVQTLSRVFNTTFTEYKCSNDSN